MMNSNIVNNSMVNGSEELDCEAAILELGTSVMQPWSVPGRYVYCSVSLTLSVAILFGNCLVIYAVVKFKKLQTRPNAYIVSLAFSDIALAVLLFPLHLYETWNMRWDLPVWMCKIRVVLEVGLIQVSMFNLCAVAIERYLSVCHPFKHQFISHRITGVIIALCWIIPSFTWIIYDLSGWHYLGIEFHMYCLNQAGKCIHLLNTDDNAIPSILFFLVPGFVIVVAYWKIFATARRHAREIRTLTQTQEQRKKNRDYLGNTKAAKVLGVVVACFFISWMPVNVTYKIDIDTNYELVPALLIDVLVWLGFANSMMNPIVYYIFSQDFKIAFKTIIGLKTVTMEDN
ncbi:5-hydroxytryptamine receptor 4-like [Gigantopelta aegis]|uniref:5-hydroxytryptamine receptor 4-like n=1 Tax=Gigantopelta aegis TaxID=1735272 RepID=UPI001B88B655|nr:5-hydroxytryptamine receptor 4-like [Gigantopelta aegis]